MMKNGLQLTIITIAFTLFAFQNCGVPGLNVSQTADAKSFVVDNKLLNNLNLQDLSCTSVADCEGVTYGSRACGGPSKALVVSKLNPNYQEIIRLAEDITEQEQAYNQATGAVSICSMLLAPVPNCIANVCQ